jgi:hypothetical protein
MEFPISSRREGSGDGSLCCFYEVERAVFNLDPLVSMEGGTTVPRCGRASNPQLVDDTHASAAELFEDLIVRDCRADHGDSVRGLGEPADEVQENC